MFDKTSDYINDKYSVFLFSNLIEDDEFAKNAFINILKEEKFLEPQLINKIINNEIIIKIKKKYLIHYYTKGVIFNHSYFISTKSKEDSAKTPITTSFEYLSKGLIDNSLYHNQILYPSVICNRDFSKEEIIKGINIKQFELELSSNVKEIMYDIVCERESLSNRKAKKIIDFGAIVNYEYDFRRIYVETVYQINFIYSNKKTKAYTNYLSGCSLKLIKKELPYEPRYKKFCSKNYISSILTVPFYLSLVYLENKYECVIEDNKEFKLYTRKERYKKIKKGFKIAEEPLRLKYAKKGFYLYGKKQFTIGLVKELNKYSSLDNFDFKYYYYYLYITAKSLSDSNLTLGKMAEENYFTKPKYSKKMALKYYRVASRQKNIEATKWLYYYYASSRYYNEFLAKKYLKKSIKLQKKQMQNNQ